ncbi:MAG: MarR family winged helix-turn-helix transcriptional regulator [Janthinobacterium lividum]
MDVKPTPDQAIADQLDQVIQQQQQFVRHLARRLEVDAVGLEVMEHLMRTGQATPSELSRELGVSTAAMTLVLDRLEAKGHATRAPHPTDRRKVLVSAAKSSVRSANDLVSPLISATEDLVSSLSPEDQAVVSSFLTEMSRVYDRVLAGHRSSTRRHELRRSDLPGAKSTETR